ncbi:MAG: hypothetical protein AAB381_01320 [Patescibacteria group bacterium]
MNTLEMAIEPLSVTQSIQKNGYALIPWPKHELESLAQRVMMGWNKFLAEPLESKIKWSIPSKHAEGTDNGYMSRNHEKKLDGKKHDDKEFFHYRRHLSSLLEEQNLVTGDHRQFLLDCDRLFIACRNKALEVAGHLSELVPNMDFCSMMQHPFAECRHVMRLLSYTAQPVKGKKLAEGHEDRCAFTLHVWENKPGLFITTPDKGVVEYTATPGMIATFPGAKMALITEGLLSARYHGVVGREESAGERRQSIVFFSHVEREDIKLFV